jgi:hypothetical protein
LTFYVTARHSGKCLDVRGGTVATGNGVALQQFTCLGYARSNQRWYLPNSIDRTTFNLVAAHSGRCADVTGGTGATDDYIPVQQYDCLGVDQTNQRWYLSSPLRPRMISRLLLPFGEAFGALRHWEAGLSGR